MFFDDTHTNKYIDGLKRLTLPSLLPRPHPLINLQLPREGLVTLATKTVASTSQNREVASRLQRANPSRHYCLTYNVTVLIRKFTKPAQVLLLHKLLFRSVVACLSSTRMLLARQQTSENEQTKAYVRTTVIGMGGASRNHRYKKFSRATVFVASVTRPNPPLRIGAPGNYASVGGATQAYGSLFVSVCVCVRS